MIMERKVEAKVKMELFPIIGRFLFAWFFIFSGFKSYPRSLSFFLLDLRGALYIYLFILKIIL
uniref:Putative ovule protein n=1 Tax=Solanum chacoense TaxID=4108 RepID=A0A0V0HFZ3_SOLCH